MTYKAPRGVWPTAALFADAPNNNWGHKEPKTQPVFTLNRDIEGLINAHKTFVELNDPTGYLWAIQYLGSWEHWQHLCKSPWFTKELDKWIMEIEIKQRAMAISRLHEIASGTSPQAISAAKYLATLDYKKTGQRGRPSKTEMNAELKRLVERAADEKSDAERIGLVVKA